MCSGIFGSGDSKEEYLSVGCCSLLVEERLHFEMAEWVPAARIQSKHA